MDISKDSLEKLNQSEKTKMLSTLMASLLQDLDEKEKKTLLQEIVSCGGDNLQIIDMVEHWIKECKDSGVNPLEMSKEVMAAISYTYDLESYSPSELRSLFDDWLCEIESLLIKFVNSQKQTDPDTIAAHLNLKRSSIIFILAKLAKEGRVSMHASGNNKSSDTTTIVCKEKIHQLRLKK